VIPLDLSQSSSGYFTKNGAFFAGLGDTSIAYEFDFKCMTCCFGGQGCVRQVVSGTDLAFLAAMGTIMVKELSEGESIALDSSVLVAWEKTVDLNVRRASSSTFGMCCGGEGFFVTTMTGHGRVILQTYNRERFQRAINTYVLSAGMVRP